MTIINTLAVSEFSYLSTMSATQGYEVLSKNIPQAVSNFEKTPQSSSAVSYFDSTVPTLTSVNQFINNPKLVDFVLSAFGLDSEDNYQGLVKDVLTQDPNSPKSLVNQLTDPRFKQLATALNFYNDGLGELQAVGQSYPTTATQAEGVTFAATKTSSNTTVAHTGVLSTTVNTSVPVGIGVQLPNNQYFAVQEPAGSSTSIGIQVSGNQYLPVEQPGAPTTTVNLQVGGNQYLQVQESDGSIGYTQSGTFSIGSNNQLALADGSVLQPPVDLPSGTTNVSVSGSGQISVVESGQSNPTVVGQLQTALFSDPTQLGTDANGYASPTSGSGDATLSNATGVSSYGISSYVQSGYFALNGNNQLALPDGTLLAPPVTFPAGTTSVNIDSSGTVDAYVGSSTSPTVVGTLQTASFSTAPSQNGDYYTASDSTAPSVAASSGFTTYGATSYAQSGYFTIDSNGTLALPDGSTLFPSITVPGDTTSLSISASGQIQAQVQGQENATVLGFVQASTFSNSSQLTTDAAGYYVPTTGSGSATPTTISSLDTFGATNQVQTNFVESAATTSVSGSVSVGLGVGGNEYLVLNKSDGTTAYAKSALFTINSNNQLVTSDGSTLNDAPILPPGTTAVTVDASGSLYAQVKGQTAPQEVGSLEIATFGNPSALSKNSAGYLTPTLNSGAPSLSFVSNSSSYAFGNTLQTLVNDYVQNEFEVAVGTNDSAVREALYFGRNISADEKSAGTKTATQADVILGDPVLDNLVMTALGQPAQIAYEQISSQENIVENGIQLKNLQSPKYVAQLTSQYLAVYDSQNAVGSSVASSATSPALQILNAFASGSSGSGSSAANSILSLSV